MSLLSVAVEVGNIHAHASFGYAVSIDCTPTNVRFVLESAILLVDPQLVGVAIIGYVNNIRRR
jgi:hypothetical protein